MIFGVKQLKEIALSMAVVEDGVRAHNGSTWKFKLQQCLPRAKQRNQFSLDPT